MCFSCFICLCFLLVCSTCSFLEKWPDADFVIYIIEQTNDGRKFNRGKLLNVGYDLAKKDGCAVVVFHDVDLPPSDELLPYYCTVPEPGKPCHIARVMSPHFVFTIPSVTCMAVCVRAVVTQPHSLRSLA